MCMRVRERVSVSPHTHPSISQPAVSPVRLRVAPRGTHTHNAVAVVVTIIDQGQIATISGTRWLAAGDADVPHGRYTAHGTRHTAHGVAPLAGRTPQVMLPVVERGGAGGCMRRRRQGKKERTAVHPTRR